MYNSISLAYNYCDRVYLLPLYYFAITLRRSDYRCLVTKQLEDCNKTFRFQSYTYAILRVVRNAFFVIYVISYV